MRLEEIRELLVTTESSDWNRIDGFPTYRDHVGPLVDAKPVESHHSVAAYEADVRLTLAWGMDPPGDENPHDTGTAPWWPEGLGSSVVSFLVDVFFCNSLVDRYVGALVDHEACLPYPRAHMFGDVSNYGAPVGWTATRWQVELFRLVHYLDQRPANYDSYVERSGLVVDDSE